MARELAAWREKQAKEKDRPVGKILSDRGIIILANKQPQNQNELRNVRAVDQGTVNRWPRDILAAIGRGLSAEPIPLSKSNRPKEEPVDQATISLCESFVRVRTLETNIAYELVVNRDEIMRLVVAKRCGDPVLEDVRDVRILVGWRRKLVGEELLDLLRGNKQLRVGDQGLVEIT